MYWLSGNDVKWPESDGMTWPGCTAGSGWEPRCSPPRAARSRQPTSSWGSRTPRMRAGHHHHHHCNYDDHHHHLDEVHVLAEHLAEVPPPLPQVAEDSPAGGGGGLPVLTIMMELQNCSPLPPQIIVCQWHISCEHLLTPSTICSD